MVAGPLLSKRVSLPLQGVTSCRNVVRGAALCRAGIRTYHAIDVSSPRLTWNRIEPRVMTSTAALVPLARREGHASPDRGIGTSSSAALPRRCAQAGPRRTRWSPARQEKHATLRCVSDMTPSPSSRRESADSRSCLQFTQQACVKLRDDSSALSYWLRHRLSARRVSGRR